MALIPGNLLSENNQSVETSIGDWATFGDRSSAIVQSSTQAHDGTFSIKCTHNSTISDGAMCSITTVGEQPVTVAGTSYTGAFWVYPSVTASFYMLVDWYQSNGTTYVNTTTGNSSSCAANTWTKVGVTGTHLAPALGVRARVYLNNLSGMTTGDIAYFDEVFFGIPRPNIVRPNTQQAIVRSNFW